MNNKALTLALVMAVLAVFFVQSYVTSVEDEAKKTLGMEVYVVRAKSDIKESETINESMIEPDVIPQKFAEPSAVRFARKSQDKEVMRSLVGTVALIPIRKGEQITYNKITELGLRTGLSPQVTPGRRAVAVPVNDVSAISRLVKPGDRVDVIAVIDMGGQKTNKVTRTILQDVMVLAVGKNVSNNVARVVETDGNQQKVRNLNEDTNYGSVTLEVDPIQAQLVATALANNESGMTLSLRNNDDPDRSQVPPMNVEDLLGVDGAARMQRTPAKK